MRTGADQKFFIAVIWCCMLFFAVQASVEGLSYIFGPVEAFDFLFREKYSSNLLLIRTHAIGSVTALLLGLFAFALQARRCRVHPLVGRVYAAGVLVGGITALPMALMAEGGWTTRFSFFLMATLWILTMLIAVRAARSRRFALHRRFMVRNYALTYSAVISRLLLNGLQQGGFFFPDIYPLITWTWMIGLGVGEWWLWYSSWSGITQASRAVLPRTPSHVDPLPLQDLD